MANAKSTPGPWRFYVNNPDCAVDGFVVESRANNENVALVMSEGPLDEALANAKLIAAAPALADALEAVLHDLTQGAIPNDIGFIRLALRAAGRLP